MRRQNHLQELAPNERQAQYRAHKQNDREERIAAARRGGSTHTNSAAARMREQSEKGV